VTSNQFHSSRVQGERIIYTASPFAKQTLIYLQEIGVSEYLEPYTSKRGDLTSYLFFIVKTGAGRLTYQDVTYSLTTGNCVFINCNIDYVISSDEDLWELEWIHFNSVTMSSIYQKFVERCGGPCFSAEQIDQFSELHQQIFECAKSDSHVKDMEIMGMLSNLLTIVMEQCWHNTKECEVSITQKKWIAVRRYIEENYYHDIHLDDLADRFSINKFYLSRKFKEAYGFTINQFITNLRITHAKELLRFSEFNMTEICIRTGFNDSAYFTRVFKKEEGISPSDFKKQWRGKTK
jgi:AraC-like DNA-binding protein